MKDAAVNLNSRKIIKSISSAPSFYSPSTLNTSPIHTKNLDADEYRIAIALKLHPHLISRIFPFFAHFF